MALRRFLISAAALESEFERIRHDAGLTVDEALLRPSGDDLGGRLSPAEAEPSGGTLPQLLTLAQAYARYMDDPTHHWSPSTRQAYETTRKFAVGIIGGDVQMDALSRAHCRDYLDALRFMPRNAAKRFPKPSLKAASELGRERKDIELISAANANAHLANFSSFLNWAVNEEVIARNPIRGLRLPDTVAKKDKRHPFSADQLQAIFNAPLYRGCEDGERGYSKIGDERPRNARFLGACLLFLTALPCCLGFRNNHNPDRDLRSHVLKALSLAIFERPARHSVMIRPHRFQLDR